MIGEKAAVFFAPSAQVQERHAKPQTSLRIKTSTFCPVSHHQAPFFAVFRALSRSIGQLSYWLSPPWQKESLARNDNACTARPIPAIRVGTHPPSSLKRPKKPVEAAASTGFFVEWGSDCPMVYFMLRSKKSKMRLKRCVRVAPP